MVADCAALTVSDAWAIREHGLRTEAEPAGFGGARLWIVCPGCERRTRTLYRPPGSEEFRCRTCHRLGYTTQRLDLLERRREKVRKLERRIGANSPPLFDIIGPLTTPERPWHRWRSRWERQVAEVQMARLRARLAFVRMVAPQLYARVLKGELS